MEFSEGRVNFDLLRFCLIVDVIGMMILIINKRVWFVNNNNNVFRQKVWGRRKREQEQQRTNEPEKVKGRVCVLTGNLSDRHVSRTS